MRWNRKLLATCFALYLFSQIFFLIQIHFPGTHNFDEFHYVPSAKQFLALQENRNWEHPPLGKELIATGISLFGDRPLGWRFMSTFFGALTLVGMYLWGLALFRNERTALLVAFLTLFNQLLYVQSRIGMLDTFMFAFLVWALAAYTGSWQEHRDSKTLVRLLGFSGVMFGLAAACKWSALVPWLFCIGIFGVVRLFQHWGMKMEPASRDASDQEDWYSPGLWRGVAGYQLALCLFVIPLVTYFSTFLPYLWVHREPAYTLWDLVMMQPRMWAGQKSVANAHPYMSGWTSWPLMLRPIWYAFEKEGAEPNSVRGIILLGNPLIMWSGLAAVAVCGWQWIARRSRQAFLIFAFYSLFLFPWAIVPRKVAFYYYYYPAGMTLSLALAYVFHLWDRGDRVPGLGRANWARPRYLFMAGCALVFIYFFPILSGIKIQYESFRRWMWLSSWI